MAYLLSSICTKITGIGQLLLKLSLVVGWYPFLRHSVYVRTIVHNCRTQHKRVLIIFPLILQTIITAQMMPTGEEGGQRQLILVS